MVMIELKRAIEGGKEIYYDKMLCKEKMTPCLAFALGRHVVMILEL